MRPGHAVISGGSSGIGLALARRLAAAGWDLTLLARDAARLAAARGELSGTGDTPRRIQVASVDVADREAVEQAVAAAIAAQGPPALLVASAGIVVPGHFDALSIESFRRTMEVNYFGTLHLVRAALPAMRQRQGGRIVMIASGAALLGVYGYTAYAPTKFAVRGLAEALRSELAPERIGVSIVYPPDTDTPQLLEELRLRPEATSRIAGNAKVLSAEHVADAILHGIRRKRFTIAPGAEMTALALLHSLVGPLLHRFWFDKVIARHAAERIPG
ncbi:MAG: SDR family NAD(P)-dependent oxidoreductase [Alphaproteobacteria bacterium]|nr:SDR family NAD(P)-dependent oxidoreductase [Alphaproteobacteria bacterium]